LINLVSNFFQITNKKLNTKSNLLFAALALDYGFENDLTNERFFVSVRNDFA
jgi:hypothetical protein